MSLRDVEKSVGVSSGHLSLIEGGQVKNPSPTVLHRLATAYGAEPEALLVLAGYLKPASDRARQTAVDSIALASVGGLDEEELARVQTFIKYLRDEKRKKARGSV
jgi:transcriptional regulator with XRE-family HTH domain